MLLLLLFAILFALKKANPKLKRWAISIRNVKVESSHSSRTAETFYTLDRTNRDATEAFKLLASAMAGARGAAAEEEAGEREPPKNKTPVFY